MLYINRKDNGSFIGGKTKDSGSIKGKSYFFSKQAMAIDKANQFDDAVVIQDGTQWKVTKG